MDTTSLYYGQRTRNWQRRHRSELEIMEGGGGESEKKHEDAVRDMPGRTLLQEAEGAPSGITLGYWLIPSGDDYLKLKIQRTYKVTANEGGKILTKPGFDLGAPYPIWPVVVHRGVLRRHFRWLNRIVGETSEDNPGLYAENPDKSEEAASQAVRGLFWRGWRFFVRDGNICYFGGAKNQEDPLFLKLVEEITGKAIQRPESVRIPMRGVTKLILMNLDGVPIKSIPVRELADASPPSPPGSPPDQLTDFVKNNQIAHALSFLARNVNSAEEFKKLDMQILAKILSPAPFSKAVDRVIRAYPNAKRKCVALVAGYNTLCQARGAPVPNMAAYPDWVQEALSESLVEGELVETGYLDLWNATRVNGEYKYGGMKRVRGRWVYDPTVPGRTQNGKRFVTVAMPQVTVDTDGKVALRFRYQSKASRNTSGTSHMGYIKFADHAGFMRTASRHITKAMAKRDVHVHCSCQDFKYRWHWVLARKDAAPTPVGPGAAPPDITNPRKLVAMCKHLTAVSPFILFRPQALDKEIRAVLKKVRGAPTTPADTTKDGEAPLVKDDAEVVTTGSDANEPDVTPETR